MAYQIPIIREAGAREVAALYLYISSDSTSPSSPVQSPFPGRKSPFSASSISPASSSAKLPSYPSPPPFFTTLELDETPQPKKRNPPSSSRLIQVPSSSPGQSPLSTRKTSSSTSSSPASSLSKLPSYPTPAPFFTPLELDDSALPPKKNSSQNGSTPPSPKISRQTLENIGTKKEMPRKTFASAPTSLTQLPPPSPFFNAKDSKLDQKRSVSNGNHASPSSVYKLSDLIKVISSSQTSPGLKQVIPPSIHTVPEIEDEATNGKNNISINVLPFEVLGKIFELLGLNLLGVKELSRTCKTWKNTVNSVQVFPKLLKNFDFDELTQLKVKTEIISSLFETWISGLQKKADDLKAKNKTVINTLSILEIPQKWKNSASITPEDLNKIHAAYRTVIFNAVLEDDNLVELKGRIGIYHSNHNPPRMSKDFCVALCAKLKENYPNGFGLTIKSKSLNDDTAVAMVNELTNSKPKYLILQGVFGDVTVRALKDALPTFLNTERIEIYTYSLSNSLVRDFQRIANQQNIVADFILTKNDPFYH